jgi:hypothetical protein
MQCLYVLELFPARSKRGTSTVTVTLTVTWGILLLLGAMFAIIWNYFLVFVSTKFNIFKGRRADIYHFAMGYLGIVGLTVALMVEQ